MTGKFRLSASPSAAERVIGVLAGLLFVVVGTAFAVLPLLADGWLRDLTGAGDTSCAGLRGVPPDALPPELRDCAGLPDAGLSAPGLGPVRFVGLVGVPLALIGLLLIVRALRGAAWLDGRALAVRGALTTRRADLATAEVAIELVTRRTTRAGRPAIRQVPTLVVGDPGTRGRIRLPLLLPAAELRVLADAIGAGRALEGRDREARHVADQLRVVADNPLSHGVGD